MDASRHPAPFLVDDDYRPLETIYGALWRAGELGRWAGEQPGFWPRPPEHLLDLAADVGLGPGSTIVDVGCGRGEHACALAQRFGVRVVAVDPIDSHLDSTRQLVEREGLDARVSVRAGSVESLPIAAASVDLVWCRSVVVHLPALGPAFRECARVLAGDGAMMLQTGYATALLEPREGALLRQRLGFVEESMQRSHVESAFADAGLVAARHERYGSEFAETYEERDGRCTGYLQGIARLLRAEEAVVERFGREAYETALGMYHWQVYQMLGKVSYHAYLLRKGR